MFPAFLESSFWTYSILGKCFLHSSKFIDNSSFIVIFILHFLATFSNVLLLYRNVSAFHRITFEQGHCISYRSNVHPSNTQISFHILTVWLESVLCFLQVAKSPNHLHAASKNSDQTAWMPRLIWVLAGCTCKIIGIAVPRLIRKHYYSAYMVKCQITLIILKNVSSERTHTVKHPISQRSHFPGT